MRGKYQFRFQPWGLLVFLIVMIPNFIWFAYPAPNDVLRVPSITPHLDIVGSIFQIIMIAALCGIKNRNASPLKISKGMILSGLFCLCYYASWGWYYMGNTSAVVILGLTIAPCLEFLFFAIDRKNMAAVLPTIAFSICHLVYGIVNFIA